MGGLTGALLNSANALGVFGKSFDVIENNITNANTPGYAKQTQSLSAEPFDPSTGLAGGVLAGPLVSSRSEYVEQAVRSQQQALGSAQQKAGDLGQIEPLFDLASSSGIAGSLNSFFNSFSQLSVNPNDPVSRQAVLSQAATLAQSFHASAAGITQVSTNVSSQTTGVVTQINQLAAQIAGINKDYQSSTSATQDPGLDAQMHSDLESLSALTDINVLHGSDGAYNVTIGGQAPLVIGAKPSGISGSSTSSQTEILDAAGNDITSQISEGSLGALIQEKNTTLPGYQTGLNTLAQSLADTVNGQLGQGVDQNGAPGAPLFTYNQGADAASTLAVNASITPDQLAAASATAPGGNGNAVTLTQLATAPTVNGETFTAFYGALGAQVGSDVAAAQTDQTQAQDQLTQAQTQRATQSGVSLNEEATQLLQFQQAYQAIGKLVTVLDDLTQTLINMMPAS
jgi:flagellar hook-associated protein 1 FlgK